MRRFTVIRAIVLLPLAACGEHAPTTPDLDLAPTDGLANQAANGHFRAILSGGQEVPPTESRARGVAQFRVGPDGESITYRPVVAGLEDVLASHIHLAPAGQNGPVVAFLFSGPTDGATNGVVATGVITAADLIGPLAGARIAVIEAGDANVNVHTSAVASGEIRGQIR